MAIAGKVAITPKGEWNSVSTYEKLDAVSHNNGLYIAKKASSGIIPEDGDVWMLAVESIDMTEFNKIIDGTTIVGEATKATQDGNGNNIVNTYQTKTGDSKDNTVSFTSADSTSPTAWTDVAALASGEKHSSLFNKISTMFKNVRYLYKMLGTTDISGIDNGTVTGGLSELNSNLDTLEYGEVAGGKNLFRNYDYMGSYAFIDETYNGYPVIHSGYQWGGARQKNIVLKTGKTYTVSAYVKGSGIVGLFYGKLSGTVLTKTLTSDWQRVVWTFTPDTDSANTDSGSGNVRIEQIAGGVTYISCFQIEEGAITDYKPYIPSVKMLADEVSAQNESLGALGKCKNLLNPTLQTTTQNGVTCTNNGDGTYTLNGTVATSNYEQFDLISNKISAGTYKLVGNPDYSLDCELYFSDHGGTEIDRGNGSIVNFASDITTTILYLYIPSGVTLTNVVFKPMLTTNLNATYDDFVPYTGDGETLTHDVASLKNDLAILDENKANKDTVANDLAALKSNFQDGVDSVYNAIVSAGTTPSSKSLSDVVTGIGDMSTNRYNDGKTDYNPTDATLTDDGALTVTNAAGTTRLTKNFSNSFNTAKSNFYPTGINLDLGGIVSVINCYGQIIQQQNFQGSSFNAGYNQAKAEYQPVSFVRDGQSIYILNSAGAVIYSVPIS